MEKKIKAKIYLDITSEGIVQPNGSLGTQNIKDYYININLNRQFKLYDNYVDVQIDPFRITMQKQLINPWFIEFGLFETIKTTGITGKTSDNSNVLVPSTENLIKKAGIFSVTINR